MSIHKEIEPAIEQSSQNNTSADGAGSTAQPLQESTKKELIAALEQNWKREKEGARTYRDLAERERDAVRRSVLIKMADAEESHAQKWERKLAELGAEAPQEERTPGMRFKGWLLRQVGTEAALRQLEGEEDKDIARYEAQARTIDDAEAQEMLREVKREEESHGRIIREIVGPIGPQGMSSSCRAQPPLSPRRLLAWSHILR